MLDAGQIIGVVSMSDLGRWLGLCTEEPSTALRSGEVTASAPGESAQGAFRQSSFFGCADELEQLAQELRVAGSTPSERLHAALRRCDKAVEFHLDCVREPGGIAEQTMCEQPRLVPLLEGLETQLDQLLAEVWEVQGAATAELGVTGPVRDLARDLRRVCSSEFDLEREPAGPAGSRLGGADGRSVTAGFHRVEAQDGEAPRSL